MLPVYTKLAIVGGSALMAIGGFIFLQKKAAPLPTPIPSLGSGVSAAVKKTVSAITGRGAVLPNGQTQAEVDAAEDAATAQAAAAIYNNLPSWLGGGAT